MDNQSNALRLRHRGRLIQIPIYLNKLLRSFIYMSDWKMWPMAAIIAALVSMVVRKDFFLTIEGTTKGAFALTCVAIWNGCFNSIQVICRERAIVKREHRSGMHITSYIASHMVYQALLCMGQAFLTVYVCGLCGVQYPQQGVVTGFLPLDICLTVFLISYASDMVALLVSAIAHSTTAAMTVMPFVLIFQLVFSGGIFALPEWATSISDFTISNYGLKCIMAQSDYNNLPMVAGWTAITKMENTEVTGSLPMGEVMDILQEEDGILADVRQIPLSELISTGVEAVTEETPAETTATEEAAAATAGESLAEEDEESTIGDVIDLMCATTIAQELRGTEIPYRFTLSKVIDRLGRDKVKDLVQTQTARSMYSEDYVNTQDNILDYWAMLAAFALVFALAGTIVLEFIDKDKR